MNHRAMSLMDTDETANSEDPDQTSRSHLGDFFFISWFTDPPTQIFAF